MKQNLKCFKCYSDTAILTYEENRIYKVSCQCGCEYDFEHSSMKCAEEYHYKMLELYGEIDRAKQLQQENEQLKELLRLAMEDIKVGWLCGTCNKRTNGREWAMCQFQKIDSNFGKEHSTTCTNFVWQHADRLKGLIEI